MLKTKTKTLISVALVTLAAGSVLAGMLYLFGSRIKRNSPPPPPPHGGSISLSQSTYDFGDVTIGAATPSTDITLTNDGTSSITINSINLTGSDTSQYSQTNNCPTTLNTNSTCTIHISFQPTTIGAKSATLSVSASAGSPTTGLSGNGVSSGSIPSASLNPIPSSFNFGDTDVPYASTPQLITFTNTTSQDITINSIRFSDPTKFNWDYSDLMCVGGMIVEPNEKCTIHAYFIARSIGISTGTLTISYNSGSSVNVGLSGTGTGSSLSGNVDLLVTSFRAPGAGDGGGTTITAVVKNAGSDSVGSFDVKGYVGSRVVASQTVSGLAAGASTSVSLSFNARSVGAVHTYYKIYVIVDPDNAVEETNESNNKSNERDFEIL
jgi:hypothetical protein